jgi:phosphoglycerate dehydrogenase-like enzyme
MTKSISPIEVLVTIPVSTPLLQGLQHVSPRLRITVNPALKAEDIPADLWTRAEVLYTGEVLPNPDSAPNLKWIQFHFAGIDHARKALVLAKPDLQITTMSGAAASQAAEYILTMLLAFGHHLPALTELQRKAIWPNDRWKNFSPTELRISTVGIIGYGSIGRQVARLLRAFGTTVLATKFDAMHPTDSGYTMEELGDPEGGLVHRLYPAQAIKSMLKDSDFIVVCVPLSELTRGMINAQVLAACKPSAILVDVSRGGVVDHAALVKALSDHKLGGAALDVFPEEPLPEKSPLWNLPNVIITPHIAGISSRYTARAMLLFTENLSRYVADLPLYNMYDPRRGY